MLIDGKKVACATCIKGHRATHCKHTDRPMVEIKQKGRPKTQCKQCRELRLVRQLHVKCNCGDEKQSKRNRSANNNEHEARMVKKFVMDLSNTNLRAIAPRPKEFQLQQQSPTHVLDLSSPSPPLVSPSSSSPPQNSSYPSSSSPQHSSSFPIASSSSPPPSLAPIHCSISQPPIPPPPLFSSSPQHSSYSESSIDHHTSTLSSTAMPPLSTSSSCRCRPGNSCGCKKSDGSTGSCCGSSSSTSTINSSTSSCCGSTSQAAPTSSCCGSASQAAPTSSCCGSTSQAAPTSSCCGPTSQATSISTSMPSLPPLRQLDNETTTLPPKSSSCCSSTIESPVETISGSITNTLLDISTPSSPPPPPPQLSPQSMLHPSAHLTLANGRIGTMCEDGIGKSSCCSSKQRNALGEIIRVVTCRCGDDCACIGCDAHPSRAMKSSQQDPYAGYTDLSMGRRRLSIAAICSNTSSADSSSSSSASTSSSSSSTTPTSPPPPPLLPSNQPPQQQQQQYQNNSSINRPSTPKYGMLNKPPTSSKQINDIPTSVLGEHGILLCGCGCSNTLDECTDCFQELCQDYYSGR